MARTKIGFIPVKTSNGAPPALINLPLVQTAYYEGNVLRINGTTGSGKLAAAAGTSIAGVIACNVSNGSAASGYWPVYKADDNTIFEARMLVTKAPQSMVGDTCDIALASTYNYRLQGTSSTAVVSIVGFDPDESLSTHTNGKYWVKFARSLWASTKSGSGF